jgi:hypothetical protein
MNTYSKFLSLVSLSIVHTVYIPKFVYRTSIVVKYSMFAVCTHTKPMNLSYSFYAVVHCNGSCVVLYVLRTVMMMTLESAEGTELYRVQPQWWLSARTLYICRYHHRAVYPLLPPLQLFLHPFASPYNYFSWFTTFLSIAARSLADNVRELHKFFLPSNRVLSYFVSLLFSSYNITVLLLRYNGKSRIYK